LIAGRNEVGQSLAHIEEVTAALHGQYRAVLRIRKPDKPPPPIYSISRGVGVHVFSAMPVIVGNRVAAVIYTSRTPSNIFDNLYQERIKFILAGLTVIVATIVIGLVFSRTITRPMRELVDRAARIGRGDRARSSLSLITAPASLPNCRTAFSASRSNCRGDRTTSRPSRPTRLTN